MPRENSDRNLLFGILALQMDFIRRDALISAMNAWVLQKSTPLGQLLLEQKALTADTHALLEALVQKHLALHGNDAEKSLAAVSSVSSVKKDLENIADPDVQASLVYVTRNVASPAGNRNTDQYATVAPSAGQTSTQSRFSILRPHAKGGLGEVFVAHDEELHREVALKEIQDRHADDQVSRSRFMLEAEITGGLEHPGIVPVYGLGTYGDGRPYYAMRFIRGDSLNEAINRFHKADASGMDPGKRALEMRAMLGRFVDVCNAIAYAHSRGILHRDLKPGNIMLGKYGETLVVDWGLAKTLGKEMVSSEPSQKTEPGEGSLIPHSFGTSSQTMVGSALGTPQYMSPEQAAGKLDQLGPASDVYGLGATLYCLLTGHASVTDKDVGVILQKVQRGDIPRPREVKPSVPLPLEAVCLKAMALNPDDRYSSPRLLADDIERWLADEPVSVWREPWTVKTRRWLGRHRTLVTGVASAVAIALVSLVVATILLSAAKERERTAKEFAQEQEKEARQQKEIAEQNFQLARKAVDRYHTDVSESILLHEPGMQPLRKKLLEDAREFYEQFLKDRANDKKVQGELGKATFRLAQITGEIDSRQEAVALHEKAVKIFEKLPADQADADTQHDLAACWHHLGRLNRLLDQKEKSEAAYGKALILWEQLVKQHPKEDRYQAGLARTQDGLGNVNQIARRLEQAQQFYQQALEIRSRLAQAHPKVPEYQRDVAMTHNNLAVIFKAIGKDKATEKALQESLGIQQRLMESAPHISQYQDDLARTNANLGELSGRTGLTPQTEAYYREAANIRQKLADRHPAVLDFQSLLAQSLTDLALIHRNANEWKKAEDACKQALAIHRKLAGAYPLVPGRQDDLGQSLFTLGEVYRASTQWGAAELAYQEALAIQDKLARETPLAPHYRSSLARSYNSLGLLHTANKQEEKAAEAYLKALPIWEKLTKEYANEPEFVLGLSITGFNLGHLAKAGGNLKDALAWYTRVQESIDAKPLPGAPLRLSLRDAYWMRAETLSQMTRYAEALQDWNRALELTNEAEKPLIRLPRSLTLARAGKYMEATKEISPFVTTRNGDVLYRIACIYSLSAVAALADSQRPANEQKELAGQFADQAVKLLASADDAGFFKVQANLEKLTTDPDLQPIRVRADFMTLVSKRKTK